MQKDCKVCHENCFQYDPFGEGCSYNTGNFNAAEKIKPGQRCLHPEFSHDQLIKMDIITFCNLLATPDPVEMD